MEFKHEELIEREVIIGGLLAKGLSVKQISEKTGLGKSIVSAHIKNMKIKLQVTDLELLKNLLNRSGGVEEKLL